ncbi:MAG: hypothetical protein DRR19_11760 [Candidatus Parabeggiatoa sp. nov. 1]|nr:MAG: hypothetical protein DRR19_11760 [Gammaproteobacteria bacterium]
MVMFGERAQQSGDNRKGQPQRAKGNRKGIAPTFNYCRGNPLWLPILYGCPSFMVAHRFHFEALCAT